MIISSTKSKASRRRCTVHVRGSLNPRSLLCNSVTIDTEDDSRNYIAQFHPSDLKALRKIVKFLEDKELKRDEK